MDILETIKITFLHLEANKSDFEIRCKMLRHLVQRLIEIDPLSVATEFITYPFASAIEMRVNKELITHHTSLWDYRNKVFHEVYVSYECVIITSGLEHFVTTKAIAPHEHTSTGPYKIQAAAFDEIWNSYSRKPKVKSLVTLCIRLTRKRMKSLTDSSFARLPVPSLIKNLLMYRDVADLVCEALRHWPECSPIHYK